MLEDEAHRRVGCRLRGRPGLSELRHPVGLGALEIYPAGKKGDRLARAIDPCLEAQAEGIGII